MERKGSIPLNDVSFGEFVIYIWLAFSFPHMFIIEKSFNVFKLVFYPEIDSTNTFVGDQCEFYNALAFQG